MCSVSADDYYTITNFKYPHARIAKWGKGDGDWGTYTEGFYEDQLWKLVPRFKAEIRNVTVWSVDNRQGTLDFTEEITVTTGLKLTTSSSVSTKFGFERSLEASVSVADIGAKDTTKIFAEIQASLAHSEEKEWSRQSKITFRAPKGKLYCVKQLACDFQSPLVTDDCLLTCNYVIEETD